MTMTPPSSPNVSRDSLPDNSILDTSVLSASKYSGTFLEGTSLPKRSKSQTRLEEGYYYEHFQKQSAATNDSWKFSCDDHTFACMDRKQDDEPLIDGALNKVMDTMETIFFFPVSGGMKMCTSDDSVNGEDTDMHSLVENKRKVADV